MAERDSGRGPFETLTLAGLGALALAAGRADDVAEELAHRLGIEPDEVRAALRDVLETWRAEVGRVGGQTGDVAGRVVSELGVASRDALAELELRVAQLEHRLKLLERAP
jgi:polyhydroxyalkanoate synthesis regulator phasin